MDDAVVKVGQTVRLPESHRGTVLEVDHVYQAARVALNEGGFEVWCRIDELEPVPAWDKRRIDYIGESR